MTDSIYKKEYQLIIKRLKIARIESGLSQISVANKLCKPQSYISKIERGERRVDIAELVILAKIYKKTLSCFIKN